ncbi:MAG TPA: hypothetical protein VIB79_17655 [Candidatus Binatia bacterium]|jgi:hypothetical protein
MMQGIANLARVLVIALLPIAVGALNVRAMDSSGRYFAYGLGQRNCSDYLRFRERKLEGLEKKYDRYTKEELYEIVDKVIESWIAGYLTATDLYLADTYNIAGTPSMDELKNRLESICRSNDKQPFAAAMAMLVQDLNPNRVKVEPAK